ncbi:MAG: hypothetical protein QF595_12480 [Dehalococcoidia bacterium]|nr:hypothetical protein [Dehalococcoidia bacterium]
MRSGQVVTDSLFRLTGHSICPQNLPSWPKDQNPSDATDNHAHSMRCHFWQDVFAATGQGRMPNLDGMVRPLIATAI